MKNQFMLLRIISHTNNHDLFIMILMLVDNAFSTLFTVFTFKQQIKNNCI